MEKKEPKNNRTYGCFNVTLSICLAYLLMAAFSAQGIYNWSTRLAVSPFSQDLRETSELMWAAAADAGLESPRIAIESWFLSLQDAHPLLYPRTYERTVELRQKRRLRKLENAQIEKTKPKLAAKMLKEKQTMELDSGGSTSKRPRVLIVGDSIMMTVGPVLKDTVTNSMAGSAIVRAKLATGLARPDVFDWNREIKETAGKSKFDLIVMMIGTNDSQDFVENGQIMTYGNSDWVNVYNKRLQSVMKSACQGAEKVLWFGLPPMKSVKFDRKTHRINSWAKKQAFSSDCVEYVSTDKILGDQDGRYAAYLKVGEKLEKVRMVDGIHVTKKGGHLISKYLLEKFTPTASGKALTH